MTFRKFLTEATKEDFWALADLQRDKPENAMLRAQFAMVGGIMNPAVEHVGDLIHRMSEKPGFEYAGYEFVKDKVRKCLRYLIQGYGFEREFLENMKNNAKYKKIPFEQYFAKVKSALNKYADEHAKLPTYNHAQKLAQTAAVSLGRLDFQTTIKALQELQSHLGSVEEWIAFAHQGLK